MNEWFVEIAKGIGRFFFHPLVYWFFIITFLASLTRIKKERNMFGTKIYDIFDEIRYTWKSALLFGFAISVLTVGIGAHFSLVMVSVLAVVTMLLSITKRFTWLSSAYTFGFAYLVLLLAPYYQELLPSDMNVTLSDLQWVIFTVMMGLFIIYESYLLSHIQEDETFPERIQGVRGKKIGQHRVKKAALIPIISLFPAGTLVSSIEWWPIISIGDQSFGFIVFPVMIGFEHVVKGMLPKKALHRFTQSLLILGLIVVGMGVAGYYLSIFTLISVIIALIGREALSIRFRLKDRQQRPFFTPEQDGLRILGIIPGTPAEEMELMIGEKIIKVNGHQVQSEQHFYEALQSNRTYCKLDILDERGEIRFAQRALYQGEHHELGVLFCDQPSSPIAKVE